MRRRRTVAAVSAAAALGLLLGACGQNDPDGGGGDGDATTPEANAALTEVFAPSTQKGGTLRFANSGDWDSLDPADTYYAYSWNFIRLYGRSLLMFKSAPGQEGTELVPDLAESLGKPNADNTQWTYTLREGIKFEDGTPVTSKDVKYAVERSLDKETFPNGPTYFNDFLDTQGYTSPYKDSDPEKLGLKAVETPDDRTITFKLNKPFAGFDYMAQLPATIPVPRAKDTGTKYKEKVVSTGPYKFETNELGKRFTMVRNDQWDPATDPNRPALPDRIEVQLNVNADDIDNRLLAGDVDVDIAGTGVQPATQGRILGNPQNKARSDLAPGARTWFTAINPDVPPLDNVECRRAVQYAADKVGYQNAFGGPSGGDIASNIMPPVIKGQETFDLYPSGSDQKGDVAKAKEALAACGQPNGFETKISYRAERPKEKAVVESLQQSLGRVGIKLNITPFPQGDYFKLYAGKPDYAKQNGLGLMQHGWASDWPDGFGFISQLVDSRVIRAAGGNTNLTVKSPKVDGLIDEALASNDEDARNKLWAQVDRATMEDASILPGVWAKALLYRPETLTNVYVTDAFSEYDYLGLGVKQ